MRHGKRINHLSRKAPHRRLMLSNMASSLILNKRISTTVAKAKALRKYVEPLITRSKNNTTHSRRVVFSYLQNKESVTTLFGEVASRIGERPGGYTRIIKLGDTRLGDNAEMCMMELVDFNDIYKQEVGTKKQTRTRRRRKTKKTKEDSSKTPSVKADTPVPPATEEKKKSKSDNKTAEKEQEAKPDNKAAEEKKESKPDDKGNR